MSDTETPFLAEHESAKNNNSTRPTDYQPTDEEKRAIKLAERLFEKAKRAKSKYSEHWLDDYKMFRGKQWKESRPTYRHSEVINMIFQNVQSVVPIMTDSRPKFSFLPREPMDFEVADILNQISEADWENNNWLMILAEMLYDGHFYGTYIGSLKFNPKARDGLGQIIFQSVDPFHAFPDPNARDLKYETGCRYFCEAVPTDIEVLKRENPDLAPYIKPDLIDLMQGNKTDLDQVRYKSPVDTATIVEGTSSYEAGHKDQALKIEVYLYSDEFDEEEKREQTPDGSESVSYVQKLKYPNGRKICIAGGVLLSDDEIEYESDKNRLIPYFRGVNYIDPRSFWGISDVEQLRSPQKIFNKLVSYALDVMVLMGNPIWKVPTSTGIDTDNLINRPGLVVEYDGDKEPKREEGVQLQPYVLQLIDRMRDWFDGISGTSDVTKGVQPGGVTAASAISDLQEAAQTRIRMKSRNLDAFLQDAGQLYKDRVFQFKSAPEIVRLTQNQNAQKYFKFYVEPHELEDGSQTKKVTVRNYEQMEDGSYAEDIEAKEYILRGDFDVRVTTGTALPFAKTQKQNMAIQLFDRQAIDGEELLKTMEWPNWQAVMARMEQKAQAQAQAQMEAQSQAEAQKAALKNQPAGPPAA
jgi:hypothetical protein